jgi:hypothetical protein
MKCVQKTQHFNALYFFVRLQDFFGRFLGQKKVVDVTLFLRSYNVSSKTYFLNDKIFFFFSLG